MFEEIYDYQKQAWTVDGKYIPCAHPENMKCGCYGREHEGEDASLSLAAQSEDAR